MRSLRALLVAVWVGLLLAPAAGAVLPMSRAAAAPQMEPPLYAFYYIWFDPTSWDRAKTDYPLLGNYSSDLESVMRQHIRWAKDAGIDGFIVSWKSTPVLNPRLEMLVRVAEEEDFRLALIYQGLDFYRDPQPVARIAADLRFFRDTFASASVFRGFGKPLVIWSGTWEFPQEGIGRVTEELRDDLLILASERSSEGYARIADLVDGDAYYWSSVDPETYPDYPEKLREMSATVERHDGLWIAPAAPGFDARLIGGTSVVSRRGGETLRREYEGALASSPDMIGLISWNEFSENTHIEPSERFGRRYLDIVAEIREPVSIGGDFDSSAPEGAPAGPERLLLLVAYGAGGLLLLSSAGAWMKRRST